jgi:hypothetical protein
LRSGSSPRIDPALDPRNARKIALGIWQPVSTVRSNGMDDR